MSENLQQNKSRGEIKREFQSDFSGAKRREFLTNSAKIGAAILGGGALFASNAKAAQTSAQAATHIKAAQNSVQNSAKTPTAKVKTLLIASHPYFERSTFIKGLQQAAQSVKGVQVRNLESIYGHEPRAIDGARERELCAAHERIVFLFPTHWFNITPMMKAWLNEAWGSVGPGLWRGKQMLVVSTAAGARGSTYGAGGRVGVELADVFLPMKATAAHCEMTYLPPLCFDGVSVSELENYKKALIKRLVS